MAKAKVGIKSGVDSAETGSDIAVALIAMHRDADASLGGPVHADVHPLEVGSWQAGGWLINEPEAVG